MSWTRASSVPTGGGGPRGLRLDQEGRPGHGGERAGHDGRDLRHGDDKELYQMAVMDEMKVELYYEANMEGLYGKNWM